MEEESKKVTVQTMDGERVLTEKETARYRKLMKREEKFKAEGYVRKDRIISATSANTVGLLSTLPIIAVIAAIFFIIHKRAPIENFVPAHSSIAVAAAFVAAIIIHEALHGLTWGLFAENKFKDIEFGFIVKTLTPYCTCNSPLKKVPYVLGSLMPMTVLGVVIGIIAIIMGNLYVLFISLINVMAGAGDLLVALKILGEKTKGKQLLFVDHPYDIGFIIYEKK